MNFRMFAHNELFGGVFLDPKMTSRNQIKVKFFPRFKQIVDKYYQRLFYFPLQEKTRYCYNRNENL